MDDWHLLNLVKEYDWIDVKAMVAPKGQGDLLDVVFSTSQGSVRFTGKDHILKDGNEAFSLVVYEHIKEGWWAENEAGETAWKPMDYKEQWKRESLSCLMERPREIRFYSDPRLKERSFPDEALLDNCSAIVFLKSVDGDNKSVVLRASDDCPCTVIIGTTSEACKSLLKGLDQISLAL